MYQTMMRKTVAVAIRMGAVVLLAGAMSACSSQPDAAQTPANNQIAMKFDLGQCQQLSPSLFKCPALDKPICDPGYNKNDVICVRVNKNGEVIQQLQ